MTTTLETTTIHSYTVGGEIHHSYEDVIVTAGFGDTIGIFACQEDARSDDADNLALGTISRAKLTPEQVAMAERNSERLAD